MTGSPQPSEGVWGGCLGEEAMSHTQLRGLWVCPKCSRTPRGGVLSRWPDSRMFTWLERTAEALEKVRRARRGPGRSHCGHQPGPELGERSTHAPCYPYEHQVFRLAFGFSDGGSHLFPPPPSFFLSVRKLVSLLPFISQLGDFNGSTLPSLE